MTDTTIYVYAVSGDGDIWIATHPFSLEDSSEEGLITENSQPITTEY